MEYVKFGKTGLGVSRLCIGCMTYGIPNRGPHPWTLDEEKSRPLIKQALDLGINFFDTANVYSDGTSEEIVGRALKDFVKRDDVVLATKVNGRMRPGPNGAGLSRKAIFAEIDNSLKRLGTDFVDLYQIHRWDPTVPIEETMEALHDVVKPARRATSAAPTCTLGSLPRRSIPRECTAGPSSSACRTTSTSSIARKSGKCCPSASTRALP
jgi:1-deoxyxylulose-5-phosphate synthase